MKAKLTAAAILIIGLAVTLLAGTKVVPVSEAGGSILAAAGACAALFGAVRLFQKDAAQADTPPEKDIPESDDPEQELLRINTLYHSGRMDVREYNRRKMELISAVNKKDS